MRDKRLYWHEWLGLLLWAGLVLGVRAFGGTSDTTQTVPSANATFQSDLSTFLKNEDAERQNEQFQGFVSNIALASACLGTTSASLTHTPATCTAYTGGYRTRETQSITYPANSICWTTVHKDTTGNLTGSDLVVWTRVAGTHYAINCSSPTQPVDPAYSTPLMKVTTNATAISIVNDLRVFTPVRPLSIGSAQLASLAVGTSHLQTGSVTNGVLGANAVTTAKILDGEVKTADIADSAVTSLKILNGDVQLADLAAGATAPIFTGSNCAGPLNFTTVETTIATITLTPSSTLSPIILVPTCPVLLNMVNSATPFTNVTYTWKVNRNGAGNTVMTTGTYSIGADASAGTARANSIFTPPPIVDINVTPFSTVYTLTMQTASASLSIINGASPGTLWAVEWR